MRIKILNKVNEDKWIDFVNKHPHANPFQMPWMFNFFDKVVGYQPMAFFALNDNEEIKACLIAVIQQESSGLKARLSSRVIVTGGPLIDYDDKQSVEIFNILLQNFTENVSKTTVYVEFRNFFDWENKYIQVLEKLKFSFEEHLNFIVDLKNITDPLLKLNDSKRRQVRKSIKNGTEIIVANSITQINEYYKLLQDLYKFRAKKPLADWSFFKNFYEINCQNKQGVYLLIKKEDKIIGGIMCILHKTTLYEWYVCGLDREYKDNYPSVMATWAAIKYAYENNFQYFDFMGAGNPNEKYGVREFKSKFGGDTYAYGRYIRINKPIIYSLGKLLVNLYIRFLK